MTKRHFIDDMHMQHGALHRDLNIPQNQKIPESVLQKAEHSPNAKIRQRADLAETLKHMRKK